MFFHFTFWQRFYPHLIAFGIIFLVALQYKYPGDVTFGLLVMADLIYLFLAFIGCVISQMTFETNVRRYRQFWEALRKDSVPEFRKGDFDRWNKHRLP